MSTAPTRPIAVDLFAGAGGMSLGLEQAGFDVVAALEYDPVHAATHAFNFPHCATLCRSICEVSADEIRDRAGLGGRGVDVVAGGPPCQGFSLIGKRAVEDVRNRLVFEFHRLVVELEATYFVMENVPGMNVGKHGGLLDELVRTFRASGYHSRPIALLTATEFGVPQGRTRLFLVGALDGCSLPAPPQETTSPTGLLLPRTPTVWDAIGDLPDVDLYPELLHDDSVTGSFGDPSVYAAELRGLRRARGDYSYERTWDRQVLTSSNRTVHTATSVARFDATEPGSVEPVSRFLRLRPDGYCNTLRAGTDSKRGAYTSPRPIHPVRPRVITVREAARLHGRGVYWTMLLSLPLPERTVAWA